MDLREIEQEDMDWIHLTLHKGPAAGCCEHSNSLQVPENGEEFPD
jgi:hypothetical protein